jgi:ABC-type methionine transport system ATPase subunit
VITTTGLTKVYRSRGRETAALDGVDLHVREGEVYGVVGRSGAGKSTLIRCVNLLERPTSGTVQVAGEDLTSLPGSALRAARSRIGMVFQHFNLLSSRTVQDNVELPLEILGISGKERSRRARPTRRSCPAARSSASASPAPWPATPRCCCPTRPPPRSTRRPPAPSSSCCATSTSSSA